MLKGKLTNDELIEKVLAPRDFFYFAWHVKNELEMSPFHRVYYSILNRFAHGEIKKLIVTVPPQHGKSEGSSRLLPAFLLGLNPELKIVIGSYALNLARDFNKDVQGIMSSEDYHRVFPDTQIARSQFATIKDDTAQRTTETTQVLGHNGRLNVVGRGGALTGKSVDISILDDVYKDYEEANSPTIRESAWKWYTTVVRTRLHNKSQQLIVYTRWHEDDIVGRIERKKTEPIRDITCEEDLHDVPEGMWLRINFQALKESPPTQFDARQRGEALWEEKHSRQRLEENRKLDPVQFECLYQGNPKPAEGYMYSKFKTYSIMPPSAAYGTKKAYIDTADTGADNLCAIFYNEDNQTGECYVTDVIYTKKPMEYTEPLCAQAVVRNNTDVVFVEANNGGRGFCRNVENQVRQLQDYTACFESFTQSANKQSRIFSNSAKVQNMIFFPEDWQDRFAEYAADMIAYKKEGGNAHDDAPDATTGVVEKIGVGYSFSESEEDIEDVLY